MKDIKINYMLARLPMGMSLFGHGLVRLPKLTLFSEWMVSSFINRMGRILPYYIATWILIKYPLIN